jgi:hypothetical protein
MGAKNSVCVRLWVGTPCTQDEIIAHNTNMLVTKPTPQRGGPKFWLRHKPTRFYAIDHAVTMGMILGYYY